VGIREALPPSLVGISDGHEAQVLGVSEGVGPIGQMASVAGAHQHRVNRLRQDSASWRLDHDDQANCDSV